MGREGEWTRDVDVVDVVHVTREILEGGQVQFNGFCSMWSDE